jgi:hypothetical protein
MEFFDSDQEIERRTGADVGFFWRIIKFKHHFSGKFAVGIISERD